MEVTTPDWQTQQLARRPIVPVVRFSLPMGDRLWGFTTPNVSSALVGGFFSADVSFDRDTYFNPDGVYLERAARLLEISGLEHGVRTFDSAVLGSWGQSEEPRIAFSVANGDSGISRMLGREYVINQTAHAYLTFPAINIIKAMKSRTARVVRWTLTGDKASFELGPQ